MKINHFISLICISAALTACASKVRLDDLPPVDDTNGIKTQPVTKTVDDKKVSDTTVKEVDVSRNDSNAALAGQLAKRSVYFDFDSYVIREEFKPILQAHAKNLIANKTVKVSLEGNTDESGGREYNLALGQKRANSVQQALRVLGVQESQMEAVSLGKEKPKALGGGDAAAAENRRTDISYK